MRGGGSGGGYLAAELARRLERRGTYLQGSSHGEDSRVYWGYADGAVRAVRVKDAGDWLVQMSEPWTPRAPGAAPLRLLVVTDERDVAWDEIMTGMPELEPVYAK